MWERHEQSESPCLYNQKNWLSVPSGERIDSLSFMETEVISFGSLFAGIGGFDLGFERAGMQSHWQVEINETATKVLEKNWPNVHRERDIKECGIHNLEKVSVICGGFPCQDISYAGVGAGLDGERSGLFYEAIRVVCELQPRMLVLENVSALLSRGMDRVLGNLAEIGYDTEWHCISAASVGAPHDRDRIFLFSYPSGEQSDLRRSETEYGWEEQNRSKSTCSPVIRSDGGCRTLAGWKTDWWKIEPSICRILDGLPKGLDKDRKERLRCLGNAVVPQVAEYIGKHVVTFLENRVCG